jgi:hypothetical protein
MSKPQYTTQELGRDPQRDQLVMRRAAMLTAAGKTDKEIRTQLGVSEATLKSMRGSPLWNEVVSAFASEIESQGLSSIIEGLMSDAPSNLDFIRNVRNGKFSDSKDRMSLRMQAAKMLLDKTVPNADQRAANEQAARIIIDGRMLGQVLRALKNAGAIDVEASEIEAITGEALPKLAARTPDDFVESYVPPAPPDDDGEAKE